MPKHYGSAKPKKDTVISHSAGGWVVFFCRGVVPET